MLTLSLGSEPLTNVLAVGCHADDIEIGCGATIMGLIRSNPGLAVTWLVLAAEGARAEEARASAHAFLSDAGSTQIEILGFRDGYLPADRAAVKDRFEELKSVAPDLVLTHAREDAHQDHRLACELTWNTFRDHLILEYEIPKWDGDLGRPNLYVPLDESLVASKVELLMTHYASQRAKSWFDPETFRALMRLRGVECGARAAEAFIARKVVVAV